MQQLRERKATVRREFCSVSELAIRLDVHPGSVYRGVRRGEIPHMVVGGRVLIPLDEIEAWIRSGIKTP